MQKTSYLAAQCPLPVRVAGRGVLGRSHRIIGRVSSWYSLRVRYEVGRFGVHSMGWAWVLARHDVRLFRALKVFIFVLGQNSCYVRDVRLGESTFRQGKWRIQRRLGVGGDFGSWRDFSCRVDVWGFVIGYLSCLRPRTKWSPTRTDFGCSHWLIYKGFWSVTSHVIWTGW